MANADFLAGTQSSLGLQATNTLTVETITGITLSNTKMEGGIHKSTFTFSGYVATITDALAYFGVKLATFPTGNLTILNAVSSLAFTTTSTLSSTLNASVVLNHGFGSAAASNITLATTMINIVGATAATSSATINVAGVTPAIGVLAVPININGTVTPSPLYWNIAVPTATDIDGDATVQVDGTVTIAWFVTNATR